MVSSIYQRFTYWFAPLIFTVFVLSYQNCSDVGFRRTGGNEGPGTVLGCLPANFDLNRSVTNVVANQPVTYSVNPAAPNTTYNWTLNGVDIGTGSSVTQTYTADGTYSVTVTAVEDGCVNPRSKTDTVTINSAPVCDLNALALSGDSWGVVAEMLDYAVNHNCLDLTFGWNAGDGTVVTNTNNEMQHAWMYPGIFVVSTDVINGTDQQRLSMPVTIQGSCPALGDLFVSGPDVAYVNDVVPFDIIIPGCLDIASITWSFGTDSNPSTSNVKATQTTYSSPGVKQVNVVVTNTKGVAVTLPHRITILSNTVPPCNEEALLTLTGPTSANVNDTLRFGVYVPSCIQATAFTWNFGDATGGSGNPVNKAYPAAGVYTVSVIVSTVNHGFITLSRRVVIHAPVTYSWVATDWSVCVGSCDAKQGTQSRSYQCRDNNGNIAAANLCTGTQPATETRACQVSAGSCTCPAGTVNNGAGVCVAADGLCLVAPPAITTINIGAALPSPLCAAGSANPSNIVVNPGSTTSFACVGGSSTQSNCRIQRCTNDQYAHNGSCITCPLGQVPNAARNACVPCAANEIENPAGTCTACPVGQTNNGSNVCVPVTTYSWSVTWSNCAGACGVNAGTTTSSYQCVNSAGAVVADNLCPQPKPQSSTMACTVAPNSCTCTPPQVNVGGVCVVPGNGACLNPNPFTIAFDTNLATVPRCASPAAAVGFPSSVAPGTTSPNYTCPGSNTGSNATNCQIRRCGNDQYVVNNGSCVTCPVGQIPNATRTGCVPCGPNQIENPPGTCTNCPSGQTNNGSNVCVPVVTYSWQYGTYGACSGACGTNQGTQTRYAQCVNNSGTVVADSFCTGTKPAPQTQACTAPANSCTCTPPLMNVGGVCVPPETYSWQSGAWGVCSGACGTNQGVRYRTNICVNNLGQTVANSYCAGQTPPSTSQACTVPANTCTCTAPLVNVAGSCVTCPTGTTYSGGSCVAQGYTGTYCDRSDGYVKQFWDLWDGRVSPPVNNPNTNAFPHAQYSSPVSQLMTLSASGFAPSAWTSTGTGFTRFTGLRCNISSTPHIRNDCNYVTNRHNYNSALSQVSTVDRNIGSTQQCACQPGQEGTGLGCIAPPVTSWIDGYLDTSSTLWNYTAPSGPLNNDPVEYAFRHDQAFSSYVRMMPTSATSFEMSVNSGSFSTVQNASATSSSIGPSNNPIIKVVRFSNAAGAYAPGRYTIDYRLNGVSGRRLVLNICSATQVVSGTSCVNAPPPTATPAPAPTMVGCYIDTHAWDVTQNTSSCEALSGCTATNYIVYSLGTRRVADSNGRTGDIFAFSDPSKYSVTWSGACTGTGHVCSVIKTNNGSFTATASVRRLSDNQTWTYSIEADKRTSLHMHPNSCPPIP